MTGVLSLSQDDNAPSVKKKKSTEWFESNENDTVAFAVTACQAIIISICLFLFIQEMTINIQGSQHGQTNGFIYKIISWWEHKMHKRDVKR